MVNELDLSETAIEKHGPHGTPPCELVKLVLAEKDRINTTLQAENKNQAKRIAKLEKENKELKGGA